ncbi:hypothetical protein ASPZODRAFT_167262 [Penicilliopsis zonata CBS 506.65]|uniref:Uncharacterized protein n=1 Tax=Penicilliopsis zonata CBS 506.65 TaxID=1073090 RepID=A0A1L9SGH5_9EURO|nr:hypothetical protein ASPZODRAFT_167262 [Penicilliopsis zonata CBS 506.65]OJJ46271.1 hypothetical protein ASPZODRAFT_167262 [Penicilliopsis zonata CBS 506.65]
MTTSTESGLARRLSQTVSPPARAFKLLAGLIHLGLCPRLLQLPFHADVYSAAPVPCGHARFLSPPANPPHTLSPARHPEEYLLIPVGDPVPVWKQTSSRAASCLAHCWTVINSARFSPLRLVFRPPPSVCGDNTRLGFPSSPLLRYKSPSHIVEKSYMEVAEGRESAPMGSSTGAGATIANGSHHDILLDDSLLDDGRSSSLSEIDDVSDDEPSDYEPVQLDKPTSEPPENDSEAETERIEDSPNKLRPRKDIIVSAGGYGASPSKLAQSTTYDDVDEDDEQAVDDSPSKLRRSSKNDDVVESTEDPHDDSNLSELLRKKRKRLEPGEDTETDPDEEEPLKKRRASVKSDLSEPLADLDEIPLSPDPAETLSKVNEGETPVEDTMEDELPVVAPKSKKAKKGKRKARRVRDLDEDSELGASGEAATEGGVDDQLLDEDDAAERGEEVDDAEALAKLEEEFSQQHSALSRGAVSGMPTNLGRPTAEEEFLEHTPWANPQHPIHQQQAQGRMQQRGFEHSQAPPFTTPAAQKRVVDINAPNGSASTIPENLSAANSSAANTPYGTEQEPQRQQPHGPFGNTGAEYETERKSGFRSLSSSPLDVRKPHLHGGIHAPERNKFVGTHEMRADHPSRHPIYSPPPANRLGLFHSAVSKRDSSPPLPPPAGRVSGLHASAGIPSGSGPAR